MCVLESSLLEAQTLAAKLSNLQQLSTDGCLSCSAATWSRLCRRRW